MDPNQALTDLRVLANEAEVLANAASVDPDFVALAAKVDELVPAFEALDDHVTKGHYLPFVWRRWRR